MVAVFRTRAYYDSANYAADAQLQGTGVIGFITGDQLHPPMVGDAAIWADSSRWREGAQSSVRRLIARAAPRCNDLVLDVGCGVGGATRMLRHEFAVKAVGLNISGTQLGAARAIDAADPYVLADAARIPFASDTVHCVLTVNMFYHLRDKAGALREMFRVTRAGGRLAFDDWVVTRRATGADRARLMQHWNPEPVAWITDDELEALITGAGYVMEHHADYSEVGRTLMADHFGPVFERQVRPLIVRHDPHYGEQVAAHLRAAIDHTIELYSLGKLRYLQIVARKP